MSPARNGGALQQACASLGRQSHVQHMSSGTLRTGELARHSAGSKEVTLTVTCQEAYVYVSTTDLTEPWSELQSQVSSICQLPAHK